MLSKIDINDLVKVIVNWFDQNSNKSDIGDDKYVTIKIDGVFVGGQPATQYNGQNIYNLDNLVKYLVAGDALMKYEHGVGIDEIHCLQSSTDGEYSKLGNPVADANGTRAWCRVKFADGKLSPWVFNYGYGSASNCASNCANCCGYYVQDLAVFRASVFAAAGN